MSAFTGFELNASHSIAVIGLGNIGNAVVRNLLLNNINVRGMDLFPKPELVSLGMVSCANYNELFFGNVKVLITALPKPVHVRKVMEEDGVLRMLVGTNILWIDHTSTEPPEAVYFGSLCKSMHIAYVEAPLTGGLSLLQKGQMTVYLGGPPEQTDCAISVVKHYTATEQYIGEWGAPATVKIVSNMMCAANTAVMGEAMTIFRKENIPLDVAFHAIRNSAGNTYVWETEAPLAMNGSYDPGFTLELHNKDLTIGEKICEKHIINLTMFQESTRLYREGSAKFGDQHGSSHPAKMIAENAGVHLSHPGFEKWTYSTEKCDNGNGMSVKHEY